MSLRIAPPSSHSTSTSNTPSSQSAPSAPGLHDTLRSNLNLHDKPSSTASSTSSSSSSPSAQQLQSAHPLEARLKNWQSTQDQLKMNMLRRNFGIGEPVRRGMEMKICKEGEWRPGMLGGSANVGGDVLAGKDTEVAWEDVYKGDEMREGADFHSEMEGRMGMNEW